MKSSANTQANTLARCSQFTPELYNQTPKYKFDCMPESVKHEKRMKMDKHVTVAHTICIMLGMVLLCISWILLLPNGGFEREKNRQLHAKPNNWSICILHCYRCFDFPELKMSFLKLANDTDLLSVPLSQFFSTQILERKKFLHGSCDVLPQSDFQEKSIQTMAVFKPDSWVIQLILLELVRSSYLRNKSALHSILNIFEF